VAAAGQVREFRAKPLVRLAIQPEGAGERGGICQQGLIKAGGTITFGLGRGGIVDGKRDSAIEDKGIQKQTSFMIKRGHCKANLCNGLGKCRINR